jgi:hypothetical protein
MLMPNVFNDAQIYSNAPVSNLQETKRRDMPIRNLKIIGVRATYSSYPNMVLLHKALKKARQVYLKLST